MFRYNYGIADEAGIFNLIIIHYETTLSCTCNFRYFFPQANFVFYYFFLIKKSFKDFIYLFFRERGRQGEREERNMDWFSLT